MSDERWPDEEEHKQGDEITPYEPFWVRWHKPLTDEEFVERTRKGAASTKRLMPYLLVFNGCVVCFVLFLGDWVVKLLDGMLNLQGGPAANPNMPRGVVLLGICLGFGIGIQLSHSILALFALLWGDRRTDLLLKYHDLAQQAQNNQLDQD